MESIIIKHIIEEKNFSISFDFIDGGLSFPFIDLNIESDVDLNPLVIKLTEIIENGRKLEFKFDDASVLLGTNPKIKLIKDTLEEIYLEFNKKFDEESDNTTEISNDDTSDDLPF
jgi:hypothetical protein